MICDTSNFAIFARIFKVSCRMLYSKTGNMSRSCIYIRKHVRFQYSRHWGYLVYSYIMFVYYIHMSHTKIGDGNCQMFNKKQITTLGTCLFRTNPGPSLQPKTNGSTGESQELCQKLLGSAEAQKLSGSEGGSTEW